MTGLVAAHFEGGEVTGRALTYGLTVPDFGADLRFWHRLGAKSTMISLLPSFDPIDPFEMNMTGIVTEVFGTPSSRSN